MKIKIGNRWELRNNKINKFNKKWLNNKTRNKKYWESKIIN